MARHNQFSNQHYLQCVRVGGGVYVKIPDSHVELGGRVQTHDTPLGNTN